MCCTMTEKPPLARVLLVLTLVWQPAPFQFPGTGLGSKLEKCNDGVGASARLAMQFRDKTVKSQQNMKVK